MLDNVKRRRRAIISYAVFGSIVIALVLYLIFRQRDQMQYELPQVTRLNTESIDNIKIKHGEYESFEIIKATEEWKILPEGYRADPDLIADIVKEIAGFRVSDLVSTTQHYERYELDPENRIWIEAKDSGNIVREFEIGKEAPSYNHTYAKLPDDSRVFHAVGNLRNTFDKDKQALRDKLVLSFDKELVANLSISMGEKQFRLYRSVEEKNATSESEASTTEVWTADDGTIWETEKITDLLDRLYNLECSGYIEDESANLGEPQVAIEIRAESSLVFYLFDETDDGFSCRSTFTPYPFYISSWQGENILKTFEENVEKSDS